MITAATSLAAADPAPLPASAETPFLFGAEWPFQPSQALRDRFYEAGFNMTRMNGGGYGWATAGHQADVADLETHGCKVILQLASHYPSAEYFKFTDSYLVDSAGGTGTATRGGDWAVNYPGGAWPQYSYAGADVKAQMEVDFAKYLSALKGHSNIDSIILHNEPGYFWDNRVYDYNPQAITAFRHWLKTEYAAVADLNASWGSNYASFDTVDPPKDAPPVSNIASWLDWRRSQISLIEDYLTWEAAVAQGNWPGARVTTNIGGPLDHWFPYRVGDNYRYTGPMAIAGIDCYPGSAWTDRFYTGFTMDQTNGAALGPSPGSRDAIIPASALVRGRGRVRSASAMDPGRACPKPVYVLECEVYSPQKFPKLTDDQRADLVRSEVWGFIGHGARAVCLWTLGGAGDANLTDGEWNSRLAACRDIAYEAKMLHLGSFRRAPSRVAVVVDPDTLLYYGGLEGSSYADTSAVSQDARGLYAAAVVNGEQTDVISESQFANGGYRNYAVILLSAQAMMDDKMASALTEFVQNGGYLIADAPLGIVDRHGRQAKNATLARLFGVKFGACVPAAGGAGTEGGKPPVPASFCREDAEVTTANCEERFSDDRPYLTDNRFGKGHALFFATSVGNEVGSIGADRTEISFLVGFAAIDEKLPPVVHHPGDEAYIDRGVLSDNLGNVLISLSLPQDKSAPIALVDSYLDSVTGLGIPRAKSAYLFRPTAIQGSEVVSGPTPLQVDSSGEFIPGPIKSADQVLFAKDAPPLVALSTRSTAAVATAMAVTVTVYNPSPRTIAGSVSLVLPAGCAQSGAPPTVNLSAYGHQAVVIGCSSPNAPGRITISASFTPTSGADRSPVSAIPVDVEMWKLVHGPS